MLCRFILIFLYLSTQTACIETIIEKSNRYDSRPISIQTLSLFNQRAESRFSGTVAPNGSSGLLSWKGNWLFRRERLLFIDQQLKKIKPDILLFQEVMGQKDNPVSSDISILSAGALADYSWLDHSFKEHSDSFEVQKLATAVGPAVDSPEDRQREKKRKYCVLGNSGGVFAAEVIFEKSSIAVFNIDFFAMNMIDDQTFDQLKECMLTFLKDIKGCSKRIVVGGHIAVNERLPGYNEFLKQFQLKDVAVEFCSIQSQCYTATPMNEIFLATSGDIPPARADRIFVHDSTYVYFSGRNFDTSLDKVTKHTKNLGFSRLWPTERFGWLASVRFAKCSEADIL